MRAASILTLLSASLYGQMAVGGGASAGGSGTIGHAPDWYVNQAAGSDSNTGKSLAQAFATIGKLQSVLAANQWAIINGGSNPLSPLKYREQLAPLAGDRVTGLGLAAPILDCSDVISAGAWSKTGGYTSVYQASLSAPANTPSDPDWYTSVWENDTRYVIKHSIADVDATPGSYYPTTSNGGVTLVVYVNTLGSVNPATITKMEYAARFSGIYANAISSLTIENLTTQRNIWANGSLVVGADAAVTNCIAKEGNKHNVLYGPGSTLTNVQGQGLYYEGLGATMFQGFQSLGDAVRGFTLINCSATNLAAPNSQDTSFGIHSGDGIQTFAFATYRNCTGNVTASACITITLDGCTSSGGLSTDGRTTAITLQNNTSLTYTTSNLYGVRSTAAGVVIQVLSGSTINGPNTSGATAVSVAANNATVTVSNATITSGSYTAVSMTGTGNTMSVQQTANAASHYVYVTDNSTSMSVDFNAYTGNTAAAFAKVDTVDKTYTQWKAIPQDAHSTP